MVMSRFVLNLLLVVNSVCIASCRKYCQEDSHCTELGDLTCQKGVCPNWGICGCPRGQAARFVGTALKFKCVTLKKIAESCSTDGTAGICGPEHSKCVDNRCRCEGNYSSVWDGERCIDGRDTTAGESCSASLGNCGIDTSTCITSDWWGVGNQSPLEGVPTSCTCAEGFKLIIPNNFDTSAFSGRREPRCVPNVIGDMCLRQEDCKDIDPTGQAQCINSECACPTGEEKIGQGDQCRSSPIGLGEICYHGSGILGGTCGYRMVCGDVCNLEDYLNSTKDRVCQCAQGYAPLGEECIAVQTGSDCHSDAVCKSIGYDALCLGGVCTSGTSVMHLSFSALLVMLLNTLHGLVWTIENVLVS